MVLLNPFEEFPGYIIYPWIIVRAKADIRCTAECRKITELCWCGRSDNFSRAEVKFQAAEESLSRNHPADQSFFVDSQSRSLISRLPAPQEVTCGCLEIQVSAMVNLLER